MSTPTVSWDETSPAGSQAISLGDDRIRELKTQLREVIAVDHVMASSGQSATTGYHNKATFVEQGSSPSMVDNTFMLFAKEADSKSELYMDSYNATRAEQQLTENGNWIAGIQYEVRMFSGLTANIPTGWVICDGTNSTPDLIDKFIRATDTTIETREWSSSPGTTKYGTGGADTATLTTTELPAHTHTATTGTESAAHNHTATMVTNASGGGAPGIFYAGSASYGGSYSASVGTESASHTHSLTTASSGTGSAFSIVPAYAELMFIMKS